MRARTGASPSSEDTTTSCVLPLLTGYFVWKRSLDTRTVRWLAATFVAAAVVAKRLVLYSISARDPQSPPRALDALQVALMICALLADAVALWAIAARINEFDFTPNRVAPLGENVILLVNLACSAVLYLRFIRGRGTFADLERWQTDYIPVHAIWAAIVMIVLPPMFGYI